MLAAFARDELRAACDREPLVGPRHRTALQVREVLDVLPARVAEGDLVVIVGVGERGDGRESDENE